MEIALIIIAITMIFIGIIGAVAPVLPGPPLSWIGLLLLKFTSWGVGISWEWIIAFAVIVIIVSILDYIVPIWGAKKFGGTAAGVWGAAIGMVIGLFFLPLGVIIGPFVGAFAGEMIFGASTRQSFKAAVGTFIGFMFGVGLKLFVSLWIAVYCVIRVVVTL